MYFVSFEYALPFILRTLSSDVITVSLVSNHG